MTISCVDGFVAAVPTANRERYRQHAEAAAVVFKEYGTLTLVECWGGDVPEGRADLVPLGGEMSAGRDGGVFLDYLAVAIGATRA